MNSTLSKSRPLFLLAAFFLVLNAFKVGVAEYFLVSSACHTFFDYLISWKHLFYITANAIIFLILSRFKNRLFLSSFYLLQAIYLFIHLSYFTYFGYISNIRLLASQSLEGVAIVRNLIIPPSLQYWIILIDLPLLILVIGKYKKIHVLLRQFRKQVNIFTFLLIGILVFIPSYNYHKALNLNFVVNYLTHGEVMIVESAGLFANDCLNLLAGHSEEALIQKLDYGRKVVFKNKADKRSLRANIICIQVEGLDANIVNHTYNGKYITPFLHDLSSRCIYYPRMRYFYNAGHTSDTEVAVINGIIPLSDYATTKLRSYTYPNSIIKALSPYGFSALAFHNNVSYFFNRDIAYSRMGFDRFYDIRKMGLPERGWGAADGEVLDYVADKLKTQQSPFLYYIITMSSHYPYHRVGEYYLNAHYNDIEHDLTRGYFNSLSYVDQALENFILFAKKNIKNTYIFIYGDNGTSRRFPKSDGGLFSGSRYVPLFIITPDEQRYIEDNRIVSLLDLGPTILYASGVDFAIKTYGVNLLDFPAAPGRPGSVHTH